MANIKVIHDSLLTLHKEFDILNKENERVWGIAEGMQKTLKDLMKKPDVEFVVKTKKKRHVKKNKKKLEITKEKDVNDNKPNGKRVMSPEGKQRIREGVQRRWEKYRQEKMTQRTS